MEQNLCTGSEICSCDFCYRCFYMGNRDGEDRREKSRDYMRDHADCRMFYYCKVDIVSGIRRKRSAFFPFRGSYAPNSEYPRTLLMNVLLFLPFGISFPYLLRGKNRAFKTAAAALGISFLAEVLQYVFAIGVTEADDLICNTAGALLGSIGYYISSSFPSMR